MRQKSVLRAGPFLLFVLFLSAASEQPTVADGALINGRIFTLDPEKPWAEAVAIKDGRFLAVGTSNEIRRLIGPETKVLDARGKLVIPGLIDAHVRFAAGGHSLMSLTFRGVRTVEKIQEIVAARITELPAGGAVFGSQYDQTLFPEQKWPTKEDLDIVSPNNAVVIERVDGHSVWVNSEALKQSGITKDTKDPFGGEIVKDPATGEPTGILKEAAAGLLKVKTPPSETTPREDIERALSYAARLGLTGVHTAASLEELEVCRQIRSEGLLSLRIYAWIPPDQVEKYAGRGFKPGQGDDRLKVGFVEASVDGTLGSGTALMFEPFADEPLKIGLPRYTEVDLNVMIERAYRNGNQIGVHAVGDKGVRWVLDGVDRAEKRLGKKGLRPRIEHAQVIVPSDLKRFKDLGVIASMQPSRCTTDLRFCEARIGKERSKNADVWRSLIEAGVHIAFGSDWPAEPLDPMRGLYSAVTRKNIELDYPPGGWFPEQRLTLSEAIELFALGSAYASFEEKDKGSIEPGKLADMVVLSKDFFRLDPREILTTEVLYTVVGGKIVYNR